jgi:hypothetical protein
MADDTNVTPPANLPAGAPPVVAPVVSAANRAAVEPAPEPPGTKQHKIKTRKPKQRACDERDEKGKLCGGHLKRWYDYPKDVATLIGKNAEIYRCEFCKTLYKPDLAELPHSYTNRF